MAETFVVDDNLKATLAAQSPEEFEALKQVGVYYSLVYNQRRAGWVNLFVGGFVLCFSVLGTAFLPSEFATIQAILGVMVVGQSLLVVIRFRDRGFLVLAIVVLLCGLWNIFLKIYTSDPLGIEELVGILGVYQIWGAYQSYEAHKIFSRLPTPMPVPELIQGYDLIWEGIAHSTSAVSPELAKKPHDANRRQWNWILLPDRAFLANMREKRLILVSKSDLVIVPKNPKVIDKDVFSVYAQIERQYLVAKIQRHSFQEYMAWKGITNPQAEVNSKLVRTCWILKMSDWLTFILPILFILTIVLTILVAIKYA